MPLPFLYILHPAEERLPGITEWLAEADRRKCASAEWDGCNVQRVPHSLQAGFDVATITDRVRRNPGPIIVVQSVQQRLVIRLEQMIRRHAQVICVPVYDSETLWNVIEAARKSYEAGEPLISMRELLAYRILRKLANQDKWGGEAKNKAYLWSEDLPNGGFPAEVAAGRREILDIADMLKRNGILVAKTSEGQQKYALASKEIVQPILDGKNFDNVPALSKFFQGDARRVSVRLLVSD